jgi:hypothetical protein
MVVLNKMGPETSNYWIQHFAELTMIGSQNIVIIFSHSTYNMNKSGAKHHIPNPNTYLNGRLYWITDRNDICFYNNLFLNAYVFAKQYFDCNTSRLLIKLQSEKIRRHSDTGVKIVANSNKNLCLAKM